MQRTRGNRLDQPSPHPASVASGFGPPSRRPRAADRQVVRRQGAQGIASRRRQVKSIVVKRFETPDEAREFEKGRFELATLGSLTIGGAAYAPG